MITTSGRLWVMTDRDRFGLRGSVRFCELHRTWYTRGCGPDACQTEERNDVTVVEFRPDGSLERHWYKNPPPNLSEWTNFYEYDDGNQLTTVRAEQGGTVTITRLYEYDSAGRISQIIMPDKDGQQRVAETYSYDADGRKKKIVHIDPELPSGGCRMFGVDGTDAVYDSPGATSITSIYNERGRPIEHLFHDSSGEVITRIDFRHDERGNLVEEVCSQQKLPPEMIVDISPEQLEAVRMLFTFRRHHRYDEQDRRIETSSNIFPKDIDLETFAYNGHGDVITNISESSHTEYAFGEEGTLTPKPDSTRSHRSETQFRYQYDPHGNWIEKIAETPGGPVWSLEHRTISYFQ
jgi:YD repeat-containing protein